MNLVKSQDTKLIYRNLLHFYKQQKIRKRIKETILFTVVTKVIEHLGINLPKEAKSLYSENYKKMLE